MINKYIKNNYKLYAFVLGFITFFMYLSYSEFVGGRFCALYGDCLEIYAGAIKSFVRNVINGESIFYSWSNSLGMNSSFFYAADGTIFSITMPLYFIFNKCDYSIITCFALAIKAGLSSLFFYIYVTKIYNTKVYSSLLFSVCYALCSYSVIMNARNIIWSDSLYLLPLILILIHSFIAEGKWILLTFSYFYLFVVQFYAGYVIGIFSCAYFLFYYLYFCKPGIACFIKKGIKYFFVVVIAAGMSAFLLLPAAIFILTSNVADASSFEGITIGIVDIINQLFTLEYNGSEALYPYIYCGLISLLMLPFYFFEKRINKQERIFNGVILIVLIISCLFLPLYMFWHAFDAPDFWNFRFSYLISFIICVIGVKEFEYINNAKIKIVLIYVLGLAIVYSVDYYIQKNYRNVISNDILFGIINILLLLFYIFCIYAININKKKSIIDAIKALLYLVVSIELIVNACYSVIGQENNNHIFSDSFILWNETNENMLLELEDSSEFYRINVINDFIDNGDTYFGYNGVSDFCSAENYDIRTALRHLGIYTSTRIILPEGLTDFTKMLLAIKYDVESPIYQAYTLFEGNKAVISDTNNYISCGYLVDDSILDFKFNDIDSFKNINDLASCLIGEETILYNKCDNSFIAYNENGINVISDENGKRYVGDDSEEEYKYLDVLYPYNDEEKFIQFNYGDFSYKDPYSLLVCGPENMYESVGRLTASYIKRMDIAGDNCQITLEMSGDTCDSINEPNYYIYTYDKTKYDDVYKKLSNNRYIVDEYKNGYMRGSIVVPTDDKVLYMSIPWDEGWTAYANGEKIECLKIIDNAFIGLKLDPGEYIIELKYEAKGQKFGAIISLVSFSMYIIFVIFTLNSKKSRNSVGD